MNDRFKFKAVLHQDKYEEYRLEKFLHQRVFDIMSINFGVEFSTIEIIAEYPNGDWAVREIDETDIELIQCTGLKDKNGKLIYESDIVKFIRTSENKEYKGIITYDNERAMFELTYIGKKQKVYINKYQLEVIGNIYENKELLNENS